MDKILVLDGRSLASLAVIRSLGSKGFEIHCGESFRSNLSSYSKYVNKKVIYPSPKDNPEAFVDEILRIIKKESYDLVIPVRDDTTLLLSKYKDKIMDHTNVYLADYEKINILNDKGETIKLAQKAGVPVPKTYFPEEMDLEEIKKEVDYPVVIKPRIGSGARGIVKVNSPSEFDSAYSEIKRKHGVPIVQKYISHDGGHYSIGTLFDENSNEIATHVYLETRQYPLNGGPAVTAVSIKKPPWTDKMLEIFNVCRWIGPAHIDVLYDISDDTPKLLEVNPRFWMSMYLAVRSGVDFPYLVHQLAMGNNVKQKGRYEEGMKYRWLLPNEILCLLSGDNDALDFKEFFDFFGDKICYGSISKKDPMPIVGTILQSLNFLLDKEKRKIIFDRGW